MGDTKNLILAIVLSMGVLFVFQSFFSEPPEEILPGEETLQAADDLTLGNDSLSPGDELSDLGSGSGTSNLS
ncbi:MAG: hypothetical protein V3R64_10800, partial [Sphingomonadales bacterium]